ncbi:hypothetical protein [Wocania ichthyoenteri]|uniref:hypothetical protein n=1 Tax=Wocania ichthyoenteri TaxID=1230531 RepID=UPI0012E06B3F|nr:hypothetical protein [Wocania ichthyoenteri]
MKFYLKNTLKLGILFFGISLMLINCQKESVELPQDGSEITVKIIGFNKVQSNDKALNKLKKVSSKNNSKTSNINRDIFYNAEYGFSINTDYVKYIEKEDYHSYNFSILRDNPNTNKLENLLLSLNSDGGYNAYIVTYGFTKEEFRNEVFNNLDTDLLSSRTTQYQLIDFDSSFLNKGSKSQTSSAKGGCVEEWVVVEIDPGDEGELVGAGNEEDPEFMWVLKSSYCSPGGGGATSGGDGGGGPSGPGGGSSSGGDTSSGPGTDDTISSPINQDGSDDECVAALDVLNAHYSRSSPFTVDLKEVIKTPCDQISTDDVVNEKFICIYNKLTKSSKFKNLFVDTFGESDNINVTFKVVDSISGANGTTGKLPNSINSINSKTGEITLNLLIKIDESYISSSSAIAVAKTILHESIHAYLILKHIKCNVGTPFDDIIEEIDDKKLDELLNYYYDSACPVEEQHEFMFDYMIPTMANILDDIKDDLIPENHQTNAESETFIDLSNPNGPEIPWKWSEFYNYLSMSGLQQTDAFLWKISPGSDEKENYNHYIRTGIQSFKKECVD